jgi:hypothetical protein
VRLDDAAGRLLRLRLPHRPTAAPESETETDAEIASEQDADRWAAAEPARRRPVSPARQGAWAARRPVSPARSTAGGREALAGRARLQAAAVALQRSWRGTASRVRLVKELEVEAEAIEERLGAAVPLDDQQNQQVLLERSGALSPATAAVVVASDAEVARVAASLAEKQAELAQLQRQFGPARAHPAVPCLAPAAAADKVEELSDDDSDDDDAAVARLLRPGWGNGNGNGAAPATAPASAAGGQNEAIAQLLAEAEGGVAEAEGRVVAAEGGLAEARAPSSATPEIPEGRGDARGWTFQRFDGGGKGHLVAAEVAALVESLGFAADEEYVGGLMAIYGDDGEVGPEAFNTLLQQLRGGGAPAEVGLPESGDLDALWSSWSGQSGPEPAAAGGPQYLCGADGALTSWQEVVSTGTGDTYYWNDSTGASTYDRPPELGANAEETAKKEGEGKTADGAHRLVYELANGSHSSELSLAEGWRLAASGEIGPTTNCFSADIDDFQAGWLPWVVAKHFFGAPPADLGKATTRSRIADGNAKEEARPQGAPEPHAGAGAGIAVEAAPARLPEGGGRGSKYEARGRRGASCCSSPARRRPVGSQQVVDLRTGESGAA